MAQAEPAYAAYYFIGALNGRVIALTFYNKMTRKTFEQNLVGTMIHINDKHGDVRGLRVKAYIQEPGETGQEIILDFVRHGIVYAEASDEQQQWLRAAEFEF